jgi:translation initiation factor IF-2
MATTTIKAFAEQINVPIDKLLTQLEAAGISDKSAADSLTDDEKLSLLSYLRGGEETEPGAKKKITLKRKTTSELKQSSRTGGSSGGGA